MAKVVNTLPLGDSLIAAVLVGRGFLGCWNSTLYLLLGDSYRVLYMVTH